MPHNRFNREDQDAEQERERQSWLRGTLSTWLTPCVLAVVAYGAKVQFEDFKASVSETVKIVARHETRISVIENATGIRAELPQKPFLGQNK